MQQKTKLSAQDRERARALIAERPDLTLQVVADRFKVSRMTLHRLLGATARSPGRRPRQAADLMKAAALVNNRPDLSMPVIAKRLGLSTATLYRGLDKVTGATPRRRGAPPKLSAEEIATMVAFVRDHPQLSLDEVAGRFKISRVSLWRIRNRGKGLPRARGRMPRG